MGPGGGGANARRTLGHESVTAGLERKEGTERMQARLRQWWTKVAKGIWWGCSSGAHRCEIRQRELIGTAARTT